MRSQQQAERAEQQRIKNLVLNYDLNDDQHDGEEPAFHYILSPNSKRTRLVGKGTLNKSLSTKNGNGRQSQHSTIAFEKRDSLAPIVPNSASDLSAQPETFTDETGHIDHPHSQPRQDKSGNSRSKQRARKLQMGDINDWYGKIIRSAPTEVPPTEQVSLEAYVKEKKPRGGPQGARHPAVSNR